MKPSALSVDGEGRNVFVERWYYEGDGSIDIVAVNVTIPLLKDVVGGSRRTFF
jgi:hypothetical protein